MVGIHDQTEISGPQPKSHESIQLLQIKQKNRWCIYRTVMIHYTYRVIQDLDLLPRPSVEIPVEYRGEYFQIKFIHKFSGE